MKFYVKFKFSFTTALAYDQLLDQRAQRDNPQELSYYY